MGKIISTPKNFINQRMKESNLIVKVDEEITSNFNKSTLETKEFYRNASMSSRESAYGVYLY
jgi:hypothetical protein